MTENILARLFEHNNWANDQIIQTCSGLSEAQLDAEPATGTVGSIREALRHLVSSQQGYLSLLTGAERRYSWEVFPGFADLEEGARSTGEGLLALAADAAGLIPKGPIRSRDGYLVAPWVVMVQIINHATEHREQIKSMLTALGVTPPEIDGWSHGEAANAVMPPAT